MTSSEYVYLDISIGGTQIGRVVIQLFTELSPKAAKNMLVLSQEKAFVNVIFHRVIKNFMIQTGDTTSGVLSNLKSESDYPPANLGKGGKSIYADSTNPTGTFADENLNYPIDRAFLVCMANSSEPDTNTSQFFISTFASPHLTGHHSVFGSVIYGKSVVRQIERVRILSNQSGPGSTRSWVPVYEEIVSITDCGQWFEGSEVPIFNACYDRIGGDIYEEYPDDNEIEGFDMENGDSTYAATNLIKDSGSLLFKKKRLNDALLKYKKALRYCNELIPDVDTDKKNYNKFLELKKKIFLNLSLVSLQLSKYQDVIDYCGFFLEMGKEVKPTNMESSKTLFRLGKAYVGLKKYSEGLEFLRSASILNPEDAAIQKEVLAIEKIVAEANKTQQAKYAKFFS
ncbi:hypothetical protein CANARDRAFT_204962 [[Candida] arabinofermentans NRRL YB-2248]|uniref:peptidylprolyl isomerase n=1 Tax=[Candida] arabinofermentans NRRL YB-2248 TaxID=983967 RepID=A0A1E4ST30_9ASCO|nr:hypothetical protein CANARDRAFT_204962 [[Candida] arabinofermentans NRRL YB-2248]